MTAIDHPIADAVDSALACSRVSDDATLANLGT
jgi:hypothetical protein